MPTMKPEVWREGNRRYRQRLRQQAIEAYGGQCACCGESEMCFLAIDHAEGGGTAARRANRGRTSTWFYRELEAQGYPAGYRVLCHNCNHAEHFVPGGCPHRRIRETGVWP